jgi:hypothetical protein
MERGKLNNRTSLIINPPDGKMPGLTDAGRKRAEAIAAARKTIEGNIRAVSRLA